MTIARHHRNKRRVPRPCRKKICEKLGVDGFRVCVNDAEQRNGRLRLIAFNQTPMRRCQAVSVFETAQGPIRVSTSRRLFFRLKINSINRRVQQWLEFRGVRWVRRRSKRRRGGLQLFFAFASYFCPPANPVVSTHECGQAPLSRIRTIEADEPLGLWQCPQSQPFDGTR